MQAIRNVLWRQKFKDPQEALRMFDIILRQYAAKLECLLVRQSFFQGNQSNFTDIGGGAFGCRAYFIGEAVIQIQEIADHLQILVERASTLSTNMSYSQIVVES